MTPRAARRLGPYVLGPKIGSGGMASVFAARHETTAGATRVVALKVMSTSLSAEREFRELFMREALVSSRIEHPNVVRIYDSGEFDGDLFLAMELVEGVSLTAIDRLPTDIALRVLANLLSGLHAAHEQCGPDGERLGLVHQDVSPHNVIVGYDGVTKLLDFGVARLVVRERSRTDTVRGKPGYLAPEQLLMGRLDRRVDVFAAGVIAYEIITGRRLFAADTIAATHQRILAAEVPPLDGVDDRVAAVIRRALARSADDRWETADAFRRALREVDAPLAEEEQVSDFVRSRFPPEWTRASVERLLVASSSIEIADLPTAAPRGTRPGALARPSATTRSWLFAALLLASLLLIVALVRRTGGPPSSAPSPSAPGVSVASLASPAIASPPSPSVTPTQPQAAAPARPVPPSKAMRPQPAPSVVSPLPPPDDPFSHQ